MRTIAAHRPILGHVAAAKHVAEGPNAAILA
jgi:hypothetical protein